MNGFCITGRIMLIAQDMRFFWSPFACALRKARKQRAQLTYA